MQETTPAEGHLSEYFAVAALILFFIALSIILHTLPCSTPMQGLTDAQWEKRVTIHLEGYPFLRRVPFTHLTLGVHKLTDWPYRQSFYFLQYLLLTVAAALFYRFLRSMRFSFAWGFCGVGLFLSAYPVLLGFSEPVHTWDDIWFYSALILTVGAFFRRQMFIAVAAFTVALYAREQTLTLYPIFAAGVWFFGTSHKQWARLAFIAAPLVIFAPFFLPGWRVPTHNSDIQSINFGTPGRSANSIFSLVNSFGVVWLTWVFGLIQYFGQPRSNHTETDRFLAWTSIYAVIATVTVVMQVGWMRETRLFFPPFLWMIPISLWWLARAVEKLRTGPAWTQILVVLVAVLSIYYCLPIGTELFPDLDYRNCASLCQGWIGIELGLTVAVCFLAITSLLISRRKPGPVPSSGE